MTMIGSSLTSPRTSRYGDPAEDHHGARMRAHERHGSVVVTVTGELDGDNVDHVTGYALRFATTTGLPFVLDLSAVSACTPNCVRLLRSVDEACTRTGVMWALVPSPAVRRRLVGRDGLITLPVIDSVAHAEHEFDDAITARRRGVLPLLSRTA